VLELPPVFKDEPEFEDEPGFEDGPGFEDEPEFELPEVPPPEGTVPMTSTGTTVGMTVHEYPGVPVGRPVGRFAPLKPKKEQEVVDDVTRDVDVDTVGVTPEVPEVGVVSDAAANGFRLLPPAAFCRSKLTVP
jgi:hypothetical protein